VLTSTVMCISEAEMSVLRKYAGLEEKIIGMGLDGIWLLKSLFNVSDAVRCFAYAPTPSHSASMILTRRGVS
jgi:hypothetical protein